MKAKSAIVLILLFLALVGFGLLIGLGVGNGKIFSVNNINQGLDLKGGVSILYEADKQDPTQEEMNSATSLIQGRLDRQGYTEAEVAIESGNRIRVDIPGVADAEEAIAEIGQTAMLFFAEENDEDFDFTVADGTSGQNVNLKVVLTGDYVVNSTRQVITKSQGALPEQAVGLEFTSDGNILFEEATGNNIGKPIYIFLDDEMLSAPMVNEKISGGNAVITGNFTVEYADELAALIRAGALPFALNVIYMKNVGAKLGIDALSTSIMAGIIGIILVIAFMLVMYKFLGLTADLALIVYVELILLILSLFRITLTLPGIAGIILSVGMAVDANVIIFERIREELTSGKTLKASIDSGFKRAFPAILDGNVTTLIASVVLFWLGSGPVRGFAQTLSIGVVLSMFTALVVTRLILTSFVKIGINNPNFYSKKLGGANS